MPFIRQNDTGKIGVGPFVDVSDGATMETGVTLSGADEASCRLGDDTVVDIGAFTWAAITGMDGYYDLTLQTSVTDTCGPMILNVEDVSLCLPVSMRFFIVEESVYDALFATSAAGFLDTASITGSAPANTTKPPATPTPMEMLEYVYWRLVYGQVKLSTTEETVFADDGTTELWTKAVSDSAGVVTYGEAAAGT
jgi:hypothetical protein